jgi:diguanylate cyclase (GGDEF)-like protein
MPEPSSTSMLFTATLQLQDSMVISGVLSSLRDGRLQLRSIRLLQGPASGGEVKLRPGMVATLSLDNAEHYTQPPDISPVTLSRVAGDSLTLEFADQNGATARRYRDLVDVAPSTRVPQASDGTLMGATAEYTELLNALHEHSQSQMEKHMQRFLADLSAYLLELSSRLVQEAEGKNLHYEASTIVRSQAKTIIRDMLGQIDAFYRDLTPSDGDDQFWQYNGEDAQDLGLIDLKDFEDYLAIDRMITLGEDLHKVTLEALIIRFAVLIDADPNAVRLPIHVRQLCRAFQSALKQQNIQQEVLTHIFDYFAKQVVRQLHDFYEPINEGLARRGVDPNLEKEIKQKGTLLKKKEQPLLREAKAQQEKKQDAPVAPQQLEQTRQDLQEVHRQIGEVVATIGKFTPEKLYNSVVDALNFKREAEGLADGRAIESGTPISGTWEGGTVPSSELDQQRLADARSIASVLGALQHDARVRDDVQQSDSLRSYLANNKDQIRSLKDTSGLTAESLNQLDMVDNLFGTIKSQLDVSADIQPALGNLQIPLAKLALLDPKFFVDRGHTARTVVDKLSQLATSANFPNKALESRINGIVDEIVADYESDSSVFDAALEKIDKLTAQQQRALARNIERVVRTQEGQEKLQKARQAVGKAINERLDQPTAPRVLMDLINSGWRDLLVLTHVKQGPDSEAWAEHLKTIDLLNDWLSEQQQGEIDDDNLTQRGLEAGPMIDMIEQQITGALPTNLSHQPILDELREIFAGHGEVESADVGENFAGVQPEPAELRAKIEDLPRLRRWVQRVEQLENNSWLTYRSPEGQKKRMQLAWVSEQKDRYIFVNEKGQKIADLSAIQLARQLSRGVQPPAPTDGLSVVDQSMYHTLEHVQKTLSFARNHDSLTKLVNRETFLDQMNRALRHARAKQTQHAVLFIDIDQFKLVNEVYDRVNGDQVLLEFAKLLAQLHGKKFSSARIEGDKFAALVLDRSLEQALQVAEKIRNDIEQSSVDIEGENVSFTVSVGAAPIVEHSEEVEVLLENARAAMLSAKEQGRNRVVAFEGQAAEAGSYRQEKNRTRQDLEKALATDRFVLRAQPIVQTAVDGSETTLHFELLLGLRNKDGTLSSPTDFINGAERYGFMSLVDRWVVREAFSWISELMDAQKVVPHLAINLSGMSVTDDDFMDYLLEQISEFGVGTNRLCFEITETGTISNLVKAADFVRAFRNIGCKFSIDDFGTGLASHNYLRELPVDYVKIDGIFVTDIDKNRNDYAMARSINDLAHFLGQQTIAESVENDVIVEKLREIGVDYLQGWGIARPKVLSEITEGLSNLET